MPSIFTRIIRGEIPCHTILEDDRYFSFLDIRPVKTGHTLVIPKQEVDYLFDLDEELLSGLMVFAKRVAVALKTVVPCKRVGLMVAGLEVPHAHVHLIPMNAIPDLSFANAREASQDELAQLAEKIRARL
ncbi:MAG: HIT family protein [Candidatus Omnitrophica bacterium]|nr:HIT family protein [Candidatus Omnitrophota bacterium]